MFSNRYSNYRRRPRYGYRRNRYHSPSDPYRYYYYGLPPIRRRSWIYPDPEDEPVSDGETASEEVLQKELHVTSLDLQIKENTTTHHTDKYSITRLLEPNNELVVRRGQEFTIRCTFNIPYNKDKHDFRIVFTIGNGEKQGVTNISMKMVEEPDPKRENSLQWQARLVSLKGNDAIIGITTSCNCVIGEWKMKLITVVDRGEGKADNFIYRNLTDITIILNPWCPDDQCYMEDTDLLNEYVLNEDGCVYQGAQDYIMVKKWYFAQFQEDALDITLKLLNTVFTTVDARRADVVAISRALAQIINANDEGGVLVGNWSNDTTGGISPQSWMDSYRILKQYKDTGQSVRYGQCWVFAAVLNTVCRAIGLPCRCVTNYESAHDSDGSATYDEVFKIGEDGSLVKDNRLSDSIWNFHVWNEVWFKRPDLPAGYDGWQVIDATPQELSDGVMTCGPASVKALKEGEINLPYDGRFIFAEVNSDKITWHKKGKIDWKQVDYDPHAVGKRISTKVPNGGPYVGYPRVYNPKSKEHRLDLTEEYKYPEGSDNERLVVIKARSYSGSWIEREENVEPKDLKIILKEMVDIYCGEDTTVVVTIKNINSKREARTVSHVRIKCACIDYRNRQRVEIKNIQFESFTLNFDEEKKLEVKLVADDYLGKLMENGVIKVTTEAVCKETWRHQIQSDLFRFITPDLKIEVPDVIKAGEIIIVNISFTNPLSKPLTKCELLLRTAELEVLEVDNPMSIPQSDVPAKTKYSTTLRMKALRSGTGKILAYFNCAELYNVEDAISVTIK